MRIDDIEIRKENGIEVVHVENNEKAKSLLIEDITNITIRLKELHELDEEIVKKFDSWTVTKIYEKMQKCEETRKKILNAINSKEYMKDSSLAPRLSMEAMELLREN